MKEGCICQNCGRKYKVDINVSDKLWDKIRPFEKEKEGGLLCGSCIIEAIEEIEGYSAFILQKI